MKKKIRNSIFAFCLFLVLIFLNLPFFVAQIKHLFFDPLSVINQEVGKSDFYGQTLEPNILIIENLGIKAPIIYVEENSEGVFQKALESGVVHYPKTALPGEVGNVYIFGHSSDYPWRKGNYKTVFAFLPKIDIGAKIILSDQIGKKFIYAVTNKFTASAKDTYLLSQDTNDKKNLTLQTSYPVGTALKRYIVIAQLQEN